MSVAVQTCATTRASSCSSPATTRGRIFPGKARSRTAKSSMKHVLTKALGAQDDVDFEIVDQELNEGDLLLLCSDGLTNMVPDPRILDIVSTQRISNTNDLRRRSPCPSGQSP